MLPHAINHHFQSPKSAKTRFLDGYENDHGHDEDVVSPPDSGKQRHVDEAELRVPAQYAAKSASEYGAE